MNHSDENLDNAWDMHKLAAIRAHVKTMYLDELTQNSPTEFCPVKSSKSLGRLNLEMNHGTWDEPNQKNRTSQRRFKFIFVATTRLRFYGFTAILIRPSSLSSPVTMKMRACRVIWGVGVRFISTDFFHVLFCSGLQPCKNHAM